jgi:hypothetical protein
MELNADKLLEQAIRDGLREGVKSRFEGYNSPLAKAIDAACERHSGLVQGLLSEAITACMDESQFRDDIKKAVRHSMAKVLVSKFGGEIEKRVNDLRSDPATRARITLAIEQAIAKESP